MPQKLKNFEFSKDVIAVFVSKQNWIQYEYSGHKRSKPKPFPPGTIPLYEGVNDDVVRPAIRGAMVMRDKWIRVEERG